MNIQNIKYKQIKTDKNNTAVLYNADNKYVLILVLSI